VKVVTPEKQFLIEMNGKYFMKDNFELPMRDIGPAIHGQVTELNSLSD
jgi:hypothetical protein